jgi:predicted AAA+ superfamily ATPase
VFEIINEEQPETQFINKPAYNIANSAFETLNDIRELRARYRIKMGSTMPAQSVAQLMIFKELAAANPMFMKYVIDYLPIKDKAKVKKDMDALAQTQQALQKSEGDSKKAQMFIEELLKEMARKDMEVEVDKTKNKLDAIEQETQIKMDGLEEKKKLEIEKAKLSVKEKKNAKKSDSNS